MKTYTCIFALLLFSFMTFAKGTEDAKPYFSKTFTASAIKALQVRTSGGSIAVVGQAGEAKVEMYVKANNWNGSSIDKEEIEERLKKYEIAVKQDGETIVCSAKRKDESSWDWGSNGLSISFKIWVPEQVTTDLKTSGGSINLKNLSGNQNFSTSGGSLQLANLKGRVKGRTSGGSISLVGGRDEIDLATSGGSIKAEDCKGNLRLSTSGGSIRLKNLTGSIKASTSGGSIEADIESFGELVDLSTSGGSIRANLPLNKAISLELKGNRVHAGTLSNFSGKMEKDYIKGTLNGGGALVKMTTSGGSVYVNE
jgi:hypothetical protein